MCSLVPLRKAAYVWYRTMTAILQRRERGRNNAEMYICSSRCYAPPPPPSSARSYVSKGGGVTTREYGMSKLQITFCSVLCQLEWTGIHVHCYIVGCRSGFLYLVESMERTRGFVSQAPGIIAYRYNNI